MSQKGLFFSFEKLDGCSVVMDDDSLGIHTVMVKMFDGVMQELKDVRYVTQLKRNFISVDALKALSLEVFIRDGVLKVIKGSIVVLKGVK